MTTRKVDTEKREGKEGELNLFAIGIILFITSISILTGIFVLNYIEVEAKEIEMQQERIISRELQKKEQEKRLLELQEKEEKRLLELQEKEDTLKEKLFLIDKLLKEIFLEYSEENIEKHLRVSNLLAEIKEILDQNTGDFKDIREQYKFYEEKLNEYVVMIQKIHSIQISEKMDVSEPLGLTVGEIEYLLNNTKRKNGELFIEDKKLVEEIALVITSTVEKYPVNEIFVLSVMAFETGHFSSNYVVNYNNFAGMLINGKPLKFDSREEGLEAAVMCLYKNLKGSNTVHEVNLTYCEPIGDNIYGWSENVLSIMHTYVSGIKK